MRKVIILLVLFSIFILPIDVNANTQSEETVFDYADLLSETEEETLREYSAKYAKYDISVIYLTTNDAEGKSSMTYSDDFYDTHPFLPDGVLFMIDMDNREVYINTVGKCINWLEYDVYDILDETYMYASDGEYFDCLMQTSKQACRIIENHTNPIMGAIRPSSTILLIALGITAIVVVVLLVKHNKSNNRTLAERYMGSSFVVNNKDVVYMGCRQDVLRGYYEEKSSSSGGGRSGGGSHISSRGISHGGGGRKF